MEAVDGTVREQDPGGGEVAGRVAGEEVAEVDHTGERAVLGQDVGRVQVAVEPEARTCPLRRRGGVRPDRTDRARVTNQAQLGGRGEPVGEAFGLAGQRSPAVSACRRPVGGGPVKSGQEGCQADRRLRGTRRGGAVGRLARHPRGDEPGPRKPFGGLTEALRDGDLQRKVRGEGGQPDVLLAQQRVRGLCRPGQPHREVVAEPPHLVVPPERPELQRTIRQIGVLLVQQVTDHVRCDVPRGVDGCHAEQR